MLCSEDHPRLCGEKKLFPVVSVRRLRITPAYAGKSAGDFDESAFRGDHPRLCGEKSICYDSTRPCLGSPPPMRGKAYGRRVMLLPHWITPAYAGKSSSKRHSCCGNEDHPRLCGEKRCIRQSVKLYLGSPPPMRGKAVRHAVSVADHGITPAYAGKSSLCIPLKRHM